MGRRRSKLSYCNSCMRNVPHVRRIENPILWILDLLTLRAARLLRFGPWFCIQCNQREFVLPPRNRKAPTFRPETSSAGEPTGNFIQSDESLILRRNRASRFTPKFRDGIVQRIVSGSQTITQVGRELNLSERDIVDWIADAFQRKQMKIDELNAILASIQNRNLRLDGSHSHVLEPDQSVRDNFRAR